jgi:hypothetical protein
MVWCFARGSIETLWWGISKRQLPDRYQDEDSLENGEVFGYIHAINTHFVCQKTKRRDEVCGVRRKSSMMSYAVITCGHDSPLQDASSYQPPQYSHRGNHRPEYIIRLSRDQYQRVRPAKDYVTAKTIRTPLLDLPVFSFSAAIATPWIQRSA